MIRLVSERAETDTTRPSHLRLGRVFEPWHGKDNESEKGINMNIVKAGIDTLDSSQRKHLGRTLTWEDNENSCQSYSIFAIVPFT